MRGRPSRRLAALAGPVYAELLSGVIVSVIGTFWVAGLGGAVAAVTLRLGPRLPAPAGEPARRRAGSSARERRSAWTSPPGWPSARPNSPLALVEGFGVAAVAGYGIGYRALLVVTMAFYALRQAAAIEAARLCGAGRATAPGALHRATGRLAVLLGAVAAVPSATLAVPLAALFTDGPAAAGQSVGFVRMAALHLLPYALVVALGGVHQAAGAGWPLVLSVLLGPGAQLATSAALSGPLGVTGMWAGPAVGAAVQLGLLLLLARRGPGGPRRWRTRATGPEAGRMIDSGRPAVPQWKPWDRHSTGGRCRPRTQTNAPCWKAGWSSIG
ncbi:MATE family efflux transporter [Kitasatospora sp. NPDC088160]|uniref:MATE family efflux transporter n=1 Tax=Kitasatospora sp. NPDC088160 TaxID=3364072 RepID=UPI0037FB1B75